MAQSLAQVYIHLIFSTKDRAAIISDDLLPRLHAYIGTVCGNIDCPAIEVGGVADHIHVLCRLSRTRTIADLAKDVKIPASKWLRAEGVRFDTSAWQSGYGAFSVSQSQVAGVVTYIREQEAHHRTVGFKDEFRKFLRKYEVPYDERYVWD